jgi:phosphohistidine swiveling domain-containing protein
VQGVNVFTTDVHAEIYAPLEALFIIDHGMFKQYFTKTALERALARGLKFYSSTGEFAKYKREIIGLCDEFKNWFKIEVKGRDNLDKKTVAKFIKLTEQLCGDYTKMNFEFTDRAFEHRDKNPTIQKNLAEVSKIKDTVVRTMINLVLFEPDGYSSQVFAILADQFGVAATTIENLTRAEILKLFDGWRPDAEKIAARQTAFVESYDDVDGFIEGEAAAEILHEFANRTTITGNVIHGKTASPGHVTGRVKIIPVDYGDPQRVAQAIADMKPGDILVAETTAPELIVACRKAAAIVTDAGGLLSHAAIVAREFNIPCIVDTKNASKILADGDLIDVDGKNGTITILSEEKK